ncbi:MAG: DUF4419 domain-containing protein [Armatimonas sp.]
MEAQTSLRIVPGNSVSISEDILKTVPYEEVLQHAIGNSPIEAYSRDTRPLINPKLSGGYAHGFVAAANAAYDRHYPLVLSPDMIWLLIAQGFAIHVRENAEALRNHFVAHEGKVELQVVRDTFVRGFAGNDWEGVFSEFSEQIKGHIGQPAHETIVPQFSTTGIVEKAAFEITLMDAMQEYFDYSVTTRCGIPEYYMEGTPEDWRLLREKAEGLCQFELDWWITFLSPVLEEFIAAAEGRPNAAFWRDFFKVRDMSGGPYIQGHIVNLFPYFVSKEQSRETKVEINQKGLANRRNPYLGFTLPEDNQFSNKPGEFAIHGGMTSHVLPSSLSVAPFIWKYSGSKLSMKFVAGFVGASQDRETFAIRPEIGWAIVEDQ